MRQIRHLPLLLALLCSAMLIHSASARRSHHAHKHGHGRKSATEVFSAAKADPHIYRGATAKPLPNPLPIQDMPGAFSWCATPAGRSFCGPSWNQHIPTSLRNIPQSTRRLGVALLDRQRRETSLLIATLCATF